MSTTGSAGVHSPALTGRRAARGLTLVRSTRSSPPTSSGRRAGGALLLIFALGSVVLTGLAVTASLATVVTADPTSRLATDAERDVRATR